MRPVTFDRLCKHGILALTALVLSGCGDDGSLPPPDVRGTIEVVNGTTDLHVFRLHYRACGSVPWGLDKLPNDPCTGDGCIAPGQSRDFIVEAGCYDLRARFADIAAQNDSVGVDSTLNFMVAVGETEIWTAIFVAPPGGPE